jgi:hypothetical protein
MSKQSLSDVLREFSRLEMVGLTNAFARIKCTHKFSIFLLLKVTYLGMMKRFHHGSLCCSGADFMVRLWRESVTYEKSYMAQQFLLTCYSNALSF